MKAIMDLHTHTLAAGHAYSTLLENIDAALAMGLQYLGMSEHGPTSPGGPHNFFFSNYKVIPRIYDREENTGRVIPKPDGSLRLLCGVEANICSTNGELDLEERYLQKMELVREARQAQAVLEVNNSSLNPQSARQGGRENITELLKTCMKYDQPVIMGTDSHMCFAIGAFDDAEQLMRELEFPKELVLNYDPENIRKLINITL